MFRQYHPSRRFWSICGLVLTVLCLLMGIAYAQPQATVQTGMLYVFGSDPLEPAPSAARLNRTLDEVSTTFHVSGLDPMSAYTIWIIVFNNPAGCTTNPEAEVHCGGADLVLAPNLADASAFHAGAFVTNSDGTANAVSQVRSGSLPDGEFVLWGLGGMNDNGVSPGLMTGNGLGAELHFIIRGHQQLLMDALADQLSLFDGGCPPNMCTNQQTIAFAAIEPSEMP
jgi:hypothetical protein